MSHTNPNRTAKMFEGVPQEAVGILKARITSALQRGVNKAIKGPTSFDIPNVTMSYLLQLYKEQKGICVLTGRKMYLGNSAVGKRPHPDTLSIDRIDSSKGYVIGNVRFITYHANIAKNCFTDEQLISLCRDIAYFAEPEEK